MTAKTLLMHMSQEIPVTGSISFTMGTLARVSACKQNLNQEPIYKFALNTKRMK